MQQAASDRASRDLNPARPSNLAFCAAAARAARKRLEESGLTQYPFKHSKFNLHGRAGGGGSKRTTRTHTESHVLSLQARNIENAAGEPTWCSFYNNLPHGPHGALLAAAIRSSSVRVANVIPKLWQLSGKKKMGSNQQTTRISTQGITAAWAAQATACLVTMGFASTTFDADPRATTARPPLQLLGGALPSAFIIASTSQSLGCALVTRLCPASLLETTALIAKEELSNSVISICTQPPAQALECAPRRSPSLEVICLKIVNNRSGDLVWCCFALLVYLAAEPRGRDILRRYNVSDLDMAVADAVLAYGRGEITRRARLTEAQLRIEEEQRQVSAGGAGPTPVPQRVWSDLLSLKLDGDSSNDPGGSNGCAYESSSDNDDEDDAGALNGGSSGRTSLHEPTRPDKKKVLSAKRKRVSYTVPGGSHMILEYWAAALNSHHAYVLLMLISSSRTAVHCAAETTVDRQMLGACTSSSTATALSKLSALMSSKALRILVNVTQTPSIVTWRAYYSKRIYTALARSEQDVERTALLAATTCECLADSAASSHMHVARVEAVHLPTGVTSWAPLPGVVEMFKNLQLKCSKPSTGSGVKKAADNSRLRNLITSKSSTLCYTGIARGVITMRVRLVVSGDQVERGRKLRAELEAQQERHRTSTTPAHAFEVVAKLEDSPLKSGEREPYATPANNLAFALQASETLKTMHKLRPRNGNPTRMFMGIEAFQEEESSSVVDSFNKPTALLQIVDVSFQPVDMPTSPPCAYQQLETRPDALLVPGGVSFTVAGDCPVRVPELLLRLNDFYEARALLLAASSTCCFVDELINQTTCGALNAAVASAKRILLADNQKFGRLTPFQVYRVGHRSVKASFTNSAWEGAAPVGLELGAGGGLGRNASVELADKRNHGKMIIPQEVMDEYCDALSRRMYQQVNCVHYDKVPIAVRGIPHHAIAGVHTFLDKYADALENARAVCNITSNTVDSLQCLPFGPFSEAVAPNCSTEDPTCGMQFRNPHDRLDNDCRSFLVDSTVEDVSIFRGPLMQRLQIIGPTDNPFASNHEQASCMLNALATVALFARKRRPDDTPANQIDDLWRVLKKLHGPESCTQNLHDALIAADTMILLTTAVYPLNLEVGEQITPQCYVKLHQLISSGVQENYPDIQTPFWDRLSSEVEPAWPALAALMVSLLVHDGRCDLTLEQLDQMKLFVDDVLRGAWRIASPDGMAPPPEPHPMSTAASPALVTSVMLLPVFVDRLDAATNTWIRQRGAPIGVKPGGYRQLIALLLASDMAGVEVKLYRNEGGLLLRPSSAADILKKNGCPRTDKAISPVMVEGDWQAYGTREAKLRGCARQRAAWAANLRLLIPLCANISPPRGSAIQRHRGEYSTARLVRDSINDYRKSGIVTVEDDQAEAIFLRAAQEIG